MIHKYSWILPFSAFIAGYFLVRAFLQPGYCMVPNVIGKTVQDGVIELSSLQLNARICKQVEDAELPSGTILQQTPAPHNSAHQRQTIYLTISHKPLSMKTPHFMGKTESRIDRESQASSVKIKKYYLPSNYPNGSCIAQIPSPDEPLTTKHIIIYIAKNEPQQYCMPAFQNMHLSNAIDICSLYDLSYEVIRSARSERLADPLIKDQRPAQGTFIAKQGTPIALIV